MMLKKLLMGTLGFLMMSTGIAGACEIDDVDLANINSSKLTKVSEHLARPPQMPLNAQFIQDLKLCSHIRVITLISKNSGQLYTAIASNEDNCDGGNTFGYVVKGTSIQAGAIMAMIQDSYIQCL